MKTTVSQVRVFLSLATVLLMLPVALNGQGQLRPRNNTGGTQQNGTQQNGTQQNGTLQQRGTKQNQTGQLRPMNRTQTNPQFRNPQQQKGTNTRPASTNRIVQPIKPVRPIPELDANHQKFVDQLLTVWEQRSAKIKRYEFEFERWIYMPQFCNWRNPANGRLAACTLARGKVRYQGPDRGMYEVTRAWRFDKVENVVDPKTKKTYQKAKYKEIRDEKNNPEMERWICDGKSIYEYDFVQKRIYETKLPAEMQGQGLKNSPLPFLFGAKAADIKERYWVRPRPSNDPNKFILEAYPKRISDAKNYKRVDLVLSRDPYLPVSLTLYAANFHPKTNQSYTVFTFKSRKVDQVVTKVQAWLGHFVRPRVPFGWKMIERKAVTAQSVKQAQQRNNPLQNKK